MFFLKSLVVNFFFFLFQIREFKTKEESVLIKRKVVKKVINKKFLKKNKKIWFKRFFLNLYFFKIIGYSAFFFFNKNLQKIYHYNAYLKQVNFFNKKKNKYFFFYKGGVINYLDNLYSEDIKFLYSVFNNGYISFNNQIVITLNFNNVVGLGDVLLNLTVWFGDFKVVSSENSDEYEAYCVLVPCSVLNCLFKKKDLTDDCDLTNNCYYSVGCDETSGLINDWTDFLLNVYDFERCEASFYFCEESCFEIEVGGECFFNHDSLYFYKKNQYFLPLNLIFNFNVSCNFIRNNIFLENSILNVIYCYFLKNIFKINIHRGLLLDYLNFFSKEVFNKLNVLTLILTHVDLFLKKKKTELLFGSINFGVSLQSKRLSNVFYFKLLYWMKELLFNLIDIVENEDVFRVYCSSKFLELNEKKYKRYVGSNSKLLLKFKFKVKKIIEDFFKINFKMIDDTKYNSFDFIDHGSLDSYINFNLNKIFKEKFVNLSSYKNVNKLDNLLFDDELLICIPEKDQSTLCGFFISFLFNWFFLIKSDSFFQKEINIEWYKVINFNLKTIIVNIVVNFFKYTFNIISVNYLVMESAVDFSLFKDLLDRFFKKTYCDSVLIFLQMGELQKSEHYSSNFEFFVKNAHYDLGVGDVGVVRSDGSSVRSNDRGGECFFKYNWNVENPVYSKFNDIECGVECGDNFTSDVSTVYSDDDSDNIDGNYKISRFSNDYLLDTSVADEGSCVGDDCVVNNQMFSDGNDVVSDELVLGDGLDDLGSQLVGGVKFYKSTNLFFFNKKTDVRRILDDTIDVKFFLNKKYLGFFKRTSLSLFLLRWRSVDMFATEVNLDHKLESLNPIDGGLLMDLFGFLDLYNVSHMRAVKNIIEFNIFCGFYKFEFLVDGKCELVEDYMEDFFKISSFLFQGYCGCDNVLDYEYLGSQGCCFFYDSIIFENLDDLVVYEFFKFSNFSFDEDFNNLSESFFNLNEGVNNTELVFFKEFSSFSCLCDFSFKFWMEEEFIFDLLMSGFVEESFKIDDADYDCSCCVIGCVFCDKKRGVELEDFTFDYLNYMIPNMYKRLSFQKKNVLIEGLSKTFNAKLVKYVKHLYFGCDLEDTFTKSVVDLLYQSLNNPKFLFKVFFFLNKLKGFRKINLNNKLYFLLNFAEKLTVTSRFGDVNFKFYRFNFRLFKFTKKIREFFFFLKRKNKKLFLIKKKDLINKIHRYFIFNSLRQKRINKNLIVNLFWLKRLSFRLKNLEEIQSWEPSSVEELGTKGDYISFSRDDFKKYNRGLLDSNKKIIKFIENEGLLLDRQSRLDFFKRFEKVEFKDRDYEEAFNNILCLRDSSDFFKLSFDFTCYFERKRKKSLSGGGKKMLFGGKVSDSSLPDVVNLNINSFFEKFDKYDYGYNLNITPVHFGHYGWSSHRSSSIFLYWSDKFFLEKTQTSLNGSLVLLDNKSYFLSFLENLNKIKDFFFFKAKTIDPVVLNSFYFKQLVGNLFFNYKIDLLSGECSLSSFFYDFLFKKNVFEFKFLKKKIDNNDFVVLGWKLIRLFNRRNRIFFKKSRFGVSLGNFYLNNEFSRKIYNYYSVCGITSSINGMSCVDVMNNFLIVGVSFYREYSYNVFVFWNLFNFILFLNESDLFELFNHVECLILSALRLDMSKKKKGCFFSIFLMVSSVEVEFSSMFDLNLFFDKEINVNNNVSLFFLYYSILNNNYIYRDFFFDKSWQDVDFSSRIKEFYIFDKLDSYFF